VGSKGRRGRQILIPKGGYKRRCLQRRGYEACVNTLSGKILGRKGGEKRGVQKI